MKTVKEFMEEEKSQYLTDLNHAINEGESLDEQKFRKGKFDAAFDLVREIDILTKEEFIRHLDNNLDKIREKAETDKYYEGYGLVLHTTKNVVKSLDQYK